MKIQNKDGELQEKTQWHNVVVFDPMIADTVEKYCKKVRHFISKVRLKPESKNKMV